MAGNAVFNSVLAHGSELYLDEGRPIPGMFDETLRNLRDVSPTVYASAPVGYAMLAAALESDDALRDNFFKRMERLVYGGARLPDDLYDRMQALAIHSTGHRIVFSTGWGATETTALSTSTYWVARRVKLTPSKLLSGTAGPGASFPLRHRPLNRALRALRSTPRTRRLRPKGASVEVPAEYREGRIAVVRSTAL